MLRAPTHTPPMEKMLTPVQEKSVENYSDSSDDDRDIMLSGSQKIDGQPLSRSESGLSNPSISWTLFEADSEVSSLRDSISILSEGDSDPLSRSFRAPGYSMNGSGGDRKCSKEELCEQAHLQNHKGFSQGSDDYSSAFAENSNGVFNSPTSPQGPIDFFSSNEGTPVRVMFHSEARPDLRKPVNDSTVTLRANASTHSSTSHATTSSQGSFSEDFESPDSTLKPSNRASVYEKYERYRLANSVSDNEPAIEQSQDSTHSTQDSAGTLTGSTPSEIDETPPTDPQEQDGHHKSRDMFGKVKNKRDEQWESLRDMQKQLDSGIDERGSPDTRSEKSNSLKRSSLPEVITTHGSKQFSEPGSFNSRESGLADSPDSESFLTELPPLNVNGPHSHTDMPSLVTHVLRSPTEQQPTPEAYEVSIECATPDVASSRERRSRSSEPGLGNPARKVSDVEIVISDGERPSVSLSKNNLGISQESIDDSEDEEYLSDLNQSTTAPRSLESPMFSSIARNPIQRHTKSVDNPDSAERRPRAASVDPPSLTSRPSLTNFSPKHEPHYKALAGTRVRSTAAITSPSHSTRASSSASSEGELSVGGRGGLSKSMSALSSTESPRTSGRKKRWGKRLQKTFKPALRVLRITPNSTSPPDSSREDIVRDIHLSSHTPENSPSPSELTAERVRMMSPETVTAIQRESPINFKRSQSFDDILDVNKDAACIPMTVGSMKVVPEPKVKPKKGKLFSSFQGNRQKGKHKDSALEDSSVVLVGMKKKTNNDSSVSDSVTKSPKARKKSRLPHFV